MAKKKEEQVQLQNEQLKEMLEEKSAALELMQREAAIEVALEKVRARAMAMQKSGELKELIGTVFTELTKLDFVLTRCLIMIYDPATNGSTWWMANSEAPSDPIGLYIKYHEHTTYLAYIKAWKERDLKWQYILEGTVKKEWDDFLFFETELSLLPDFVIEGMKSPDKVYLNSSFNSFGNLTLATLEPLSTEHFDILLRFAKVFDLTYTRFNDLKKAEAQAREAQIELGLERVRARAMAMQKSDELSELVDTVFKELTKLDFALTWCIINIIDEPSLSNTVWAANPDINKAPESFHMLFEDYPFHHAMMKGWKERKIKYVYTLEGNEKKVYDEYLFNDTEFRKVPEAAQAASRAMEKYVASFSFSNFGGLQTVGDVPLSDANLEILSRFGKVFDLTYTRFNDLKQAEAQAREAKIEAALEKVRGSAMAMHNSNDISSTTTIIFVELKKLGIQSIRCGIGLLSKNSPAAQVYAATTTPDGELATLRRSIHMTDHPALQQQYESWLKQENYIQELKQDELRSYYQLPFFYSSANYTPPENFEQSELGYYIPFSEGVFYAWAKKSYSDDEINILNRFKTIVDLTFRRYLDLQKAEAQARESQIQLAMERVRARTMAMQKSDELAEAASLLFKQIEDLGTTAWSSGFDIWLGDEAFATAWMANPDGSIGKAFVVPYTEDPFFKQIYAARQSGTDFFVMESSGKELEETYEYLFNLPDAKKHFDGIKSLGFQMPAFQITHCAFFSQGFLMFITYEPVTEMHDIFKRFAVVFEQTYTRFLDLQKAEAQARESQIQLALERVRARTMAMQQSDELKNAAALLFQQVKSLGAPAYSCGYNIWEKDDKEFTSWMSTQDGSEINGVPDIPLTEDANFIRYVESKQKGEPFFVLELRGERMQEHYQYLKTIPAFKAYFDYAVSVGFDLPETQIHHLANFSNGNLLFITLEPCPEFHDVFKRFAAVFEQTYTRFLDLQKAESQAREAEIELGLERVRARGMAMQKSDELAQLVDTVFKELTKLHVLLDRCIIMIYDPKTNGSTWWLATPEPGSVPVGLFVKYNEYQPNLDYIKAWKARTLKWEYVLEGTNKKEWDNFLFNETELSRLPALVIDGMMSYERIFLNVSFNNFGSLTVSSAEPLPKEQFEVLLRFAKVFDSTYTRFNDLQQVETQAREAQIELALERVRAKTMAMQRSDELREAVLVIYEQLQQLNFDSKACNIIIADKETGGAQYWVSGFSQEIFPESYTVPYLNHPYQDMLFNPWKQGDKYVVYEYTGKMKQNFDEIFFTQTEFRNVPEEAKKVMIGLKSVMLSTAFISYGALQVIGADPLSEEKANILKRFAKVFEQTYTRFLDLQKAEAQARESQIEASLERVRSKTMAMHSSHDVGDTVATLFDEFIKLGIETFRCGIGIIHGEKRMEVWTAKRDANGNVKFFTGFMDMTIHSILVGAYSGWEQKQETYLYDLKGDDLKEYFTRSNNNPNYTLKYDIPSLPYRLIFSVFYFPEGFVFAFTQVELPTEATKIFKRFSGVFGQTYRRYRDLQKAEAQAKESQIQLAMERVRARTMAMQKSDELADAAQLLFHQVKELGVHPWTSGFQLWDEDRKSVTVWTSTEGVLLPPFKFPATEDPLMIHIVEAAQKGIALHVEEMGGEALADHYKYMYSQPSFQEFLEKVTVEGYAPPIFQVNHAAYFSNGYLLFITHEPCPEAHDIFKRFAKVFEQTYTRFLDLEKAETQAREARIEAALEKVRSRSMAMHKSEELRDVVKVVLDKLQELNFVLDDGAVNILIFKEGSNDHTQWIADPDHLFATSFEIPYTDHSIPTDLINVKKSGADNFSKIYPVEEKNEYFKYLFVHSDYKHLPDEVKNLILGSTQFGLSVAFAKNSAIAIPTNSGKLLADDEKEILKRFVKVFDQAYTRFLDLQKAEAQAREAQIETALEKVRSRTMAMQRSDELANVATVLFQQVKALGVPQWTCGFSIFEIGDKEFTWYPGSADGDILPPVKIPLTEHPVFISFNESRKRGDELFVYEKAGEFQADHYRYMRSLPGGEEMYQNTLKAGLTLPTFQIDHLANFSHGNLMFITYEPFPEMHDVFKRFAKVFEQTYTRFLDLQRAEAQVLEAVKRASVDRVRAEIASMRTTNDLERITPLIWRELTTIGVPFIRCGVFIMDDEQQQVHTFLSTPDGEAIAAFQQPYTAPGEIAKIIAHWQKKKMYKQHWDEAQFIEFTKNLTEQGAITSGGKYLAENRLTNLDLHFLPFLQGMLYVGNSTPLNDDELQLVQNLADAFSTAYARYEDFNKLESAKEQIEKTLVDLKQAQAQLVQSAKMASLGELTAGIAHEIQNPLNFVNNFSEVNQELIDELKSEKVKPKNERDEQLETELLNDIAENSEKINHHGKRADAIVKGMLQHSRSSNATKEPTDINTLADEYLRLAYHGLRAKDKSFNATLKTNFDGTVGNINVIAQDIGRVILNLITNAFYATNEKSKQHIENLPAGQAGYEPTVVISTKKVDDNVLISVKDNGNGISQKVVDKIFQPFFTTKPTGQGTGLGLSLAYDIIKAHGGEIKVETEEGKGSEFIIQLPVV